MSLPLVINGVTYNYPEVDDVDWGPDATDWASAVTVGMLQKSGGLFQLLAEVDFGTSYGIKSLYLKSRTANPADAGQIRFARADVFNWRNQANDGNLSLGVSSSNILQFNGVNIQNSLSVTDTATIDLTFTSDTLSADIKSDSITNSMINSAAAIAYSKLALTGAIVNADINASAAIAYSKLNLTGSIVNADINASAAIAYSKLNLTGSIVNADINATAAIAFSKLAALSSANILVGSAGNVATSVAVTGDVTIGNTGVTAIGANKVLNTMLAQMAQSTFKGRAASSGTGDPVDLTATQATAILNNMVGDSGSGGTKGLVPAPASGDAAAGKFLKADGTWTAPAGAGDVVGPASATDGGFAKFDGTTGKLLKNSAARVAFVDLAALTSANILVGNVSNNAAAVAMTGDISITNAGVTAYAGTVPLNKGGTGQTTKAAAFDALSPMTTGGDLIYGGASGTGTRLANGAAGQALKATGGTSAPAWISTDPTKQIFTSTGTTTGQRFTITSGNATVGATYTNNAQTFTVIATVASATTVYMSGAGSPAASGTLTKSAGTGDSTLTFSAAQALATYTTPANCRTAVVTVCGAGGGGGGSATAVSSSGAGAGGGAGGTGMKWIAAPGSTYYYAVGTGGAGGTAGTNDGATGLPSVFGDITSFTMLGSGGLGGRGATAASGASAIVGSGTQGDGGTASGGDINIQGGAGGAGLIFSGAIAVAGQGGKSQLSGQPITTRALGTGTAGILYGSGGSGGLVQNNSSAAAGGAGAAGIITVQEYY